MVRAVLTGQLTGFGFGLAWFSSVSPSGERLCIFSLYGAIYILFFVTFLGRLPKVDLIV